MAKITQHPELMVATPLDEDVLLLSSMLGTERLSRLFEYELALASEDPQINFADMIGQNITVRLTLSEGSVRYFNGFVSRFTQTPGQDRLARYQATIVPWLWFLTRTADCRIFQEKTVPDIIKQVFHDQGFTDFEDALTSNYRTWEYCAQYRETDFNFVSRLMEQEGIYYYFKHENGIHKLVLADSPSAHQPFPEYEEIVYQAAKRGVEEDRYITECRLETNLQPGACALNDFDFKNTKKDLQSRARVTRAHEAADFEIYDYPGIYVESSDGEAYARKRIEARQAQYEIMSCTSQAKGLCTGYTFTLSDHERQELNREYLITSCNHSMDVGDFYSTRESASGCNVTCDFSAIDAQQPFRAARTTPKPSIAGAQTAIVVGPSGEEIYTDEFSRVKVQFHWDRYGKADENSSCWIRVSQAWAGKKWGAIYTPRIGQEVIVEFLEGDPDQPIITGRVYNGQAMPPYELPAEKTKSTLKSNSSKGGAGFNEIRFEDKKGDEQIFIHAEKNLDVRVKNDRFETVSSNRHMHVEKDKFEHVENNRSEKVGADHKEEIGKDRHLKVKGKEAKEVAKSLSLTVKDDVIEVFKKNHSEQTTSDYYLKAQNVVIEAMQNITLSVGASHIAIEPAGIEIKTSGQIKVEGTQVEVKGSAQTSVQGGAMTEVKGGIVKIN